MVSFGMNAVSFDPSLIATGVWITSTGESMTIRTDKKASRQFRLANILTQVEAILHRADPRIVFVEAYPYGMKNSASVIQLAEVGGIIRGCAGRRGLSVIEVNPFAWKSAILGNAKLKKKTVAERAEYLSVVKKRTGRAFRNPDEADAYMIWLYAENVRQGALAGNTTVNKLSDQMKEAGLPLEGRLFA